MIEIQILNVFKWFVVFRMHKQYILLKIMYLQKIIDVLAEKSLRLIELKYKELILFLKKS